MGWQWNQFDRMQKNHLHLAPDRYARQHLITQFFTGRITLHYIKVV